MFPKFERQTDPNGRRSFMKLLAAAPLFATIGHRSLAASVAATVSSKGKKDYANNIYTKFGVQPIINVHGTWTYMSGSLELPEVRVACEEAAHYFVDMFELQAAAGRYLSKISGAESGMVTSGAAGAMACAMAGCIAGTDPNHVWQLPDTTGLKGEVVMIGGRSDFDSALRLAGGKIVLAKTVEDLAAALTSQTAMVYTTLRDERLANALEITRPAGVPLYVDGAGGIPPIDNMTKLVKMGVDLCGFSGGKGAFGPQSAGILIGRKDLIEAALANTCPWEGAVCRPMKVGKEEIMGMLTAIDYWAHADLQAIAKESNNRIARMQKLIETVPGVTTSVTVRGADIMFPVLVVKWDEERFGLTVAECGKQMREGSPRIDVWTNSNPSGVKYDRPKSATPRAPQPDLFRIDTMTMQPGEDLIVGNRVRQILGKARKQSA
jgi:seryl-tRNA(Sec) selenium transferase